MREYVQSLRAIFDCWQNDTPLQFEGEHYRFTRMQPFFRPGAMEHGRVPILLGGVAPAMTALAGEVADGLVTHPTNTAPRYLREIVCPRLEKGAGRTGRDASTLELRVTPLLATGLNEEDVRRERDKIRQLLSFLYSTPAYWPSLELFGWRERGEHLHSLTREGRWQEMAGVVTDDMLDTLVPTATYADMASVLEEWYGELTDRITFPMPDDPSADSEAARVVTRLRTGSKVQGGDRRKK
jgi:probable F420-dependent oxidoreductase